MQIEQIITTLYPELLVVLALIIAIFLANTPFKHFIWVFSVFLLSYGTIYILINQLNIDTQILGGMYIADNLSTLFRLITLVTTVLIILGSIKYSEGFIHKSEFLIIMLSATLGIMFLVSANDLITLFVALETLGLSSIMLAGYSKYDTRSNEASLKYLLNSAGATAIFLFGFSLIYGMTGHTQFYAIKVSLLQLSNEGTLNSGFMLVSLILITAGIAFKLASAPLHMWSPDVYEGAPTPVTAFLSVTSKAAAFAIGIRLLIILFDFAAPVWQPLLIALAVFSMILGNMVALGEVLNKASIKRLMAYSSIAQIGYILIGLALGENNTVSASLFYLIIYSIVNLGAFLCIIAFGNEANSDSILSYSGLVQKRPLLALAFAACLFNLGGLPIPPAGFVAKFILLKASFEAGFIGIVLGLIALITTVVSIYYYSYIAKIMIVDSPSEDVISIDSNKYALGKSYVLNSAIAICVIGFFLAFLLSNPLLKATYKTTIAITKSKAAVGYKI